MRKFIIVIVAFSLLTGLIIPGKQKLARVKYNGGGDWYTGPTSIPNLARFCNKHLETNLSLEEDIVELNSPEIFGFPLLYMTGHGNVVFSMAEANNLRSYLDAGGFIIINDSYGMDQFIRIELKKVFPNQNLRKIPLNHVIYRDKFLFKSLPKIHEHDGEAAQGLGLFIEDRLVLFYNYECDLGDGWEDPSVHNDPKEVREKALKMGANLVKYAFIGN